MFLTYMDGRLIRLSLNQGSEIWTYEIRSIFAAPQSLTDDCSLVMMMASCGALAFCKMLEKKLTSKAIVND